MCYGCRPTCEDCRPKFVRCPECGAKNFLFSKACKQCSLVLPDEAKEAAKLDWAKRHAAKA